MLDVERSLVLGRQNEDWEDEPVAGEPGVPVLPRIGNNDISTSRLASHSLVHTAQHEVEEYEEEGHARCTPDPDVEPSVVGEEPLLVVLGELVKTGTSDGRLDSKVPSTELVSHVSTSPAVEMLCTGYWCQVVGRPGPSYLPLPGHC